MRVQLHVVHGRSAPRVVKCDATGLDDARQQMLRQGYTVLSLRPLAVEWRALRVRAPKASIAVDVFVEQLCDLLGAGLTVVEALDTLQRGGPQSAQPELERLTRALRSGHRFSEALAAEPAFPPLLVALARSSELTSDLGQALTRFLDHQRRVAELRHRIVSVAIYPLLLTAVGAAVLLFLLFYVMPRFARVFDGMTGELPWSARAMVSWAQWLGAHGVWVAVAIATTLAGITMLVATRSARSRVLQRLLGLRVFRDHLRTYFLARWYRTTGMLVEGGIPLPEALPLANGLLPRALQPAGAHVQNALHDGHSPSAAYTRGRMATPVAEQLMLAGERTGDFGAVLTRIAQFHDAQVARTLEQAMRVLEPVVMVLIGVGVGAVVVLMYLPIFELASAIQ